MTKASQLERAQKMLSQNESLTKRIKTLQQDGDFYVEGARSDKMLLPASVAKLTKQSLINHYEKLIFSNRSSLRMMGINPDE
jgi:hypothetical protein